MDDDSEFGRVVSEEELIAQSGSAAFGYYDLLTVALHEVGHLLGYEHEDVDDSPLLRPQLELSVRRLPEHQVDDVFAQEYSVHQPDQSTGRGLVNDKLAFDRFDELEELAALDHYLSKTEQKKAGR